MWKLSSSKFTEGLDYIEMNGKVFEKIDDINNKTVKDFVRNKVEEQLHIKESWDLYF